MAKIALVGDLHFGVRSGNENFFNFQADWIDYFLAKCKELGVTKIINPGDFFDVRKAMNIRVLDYVKTRFKASVDAAGIDWEFVPGNHDIFLRNLNRITSMRIFDNLSPFIKLHETPTDIDIGNGQKLLMMPWIDDNISPNLTKYIAESKATYMAGHLELAGFPMYAHSMAEHGLDLTLFGKFKRVWSGHYHTVSERQNIQYLGSPYHLTWGDVPDGTNRGFFIFDTETGEQTMIKNPEWMSLFQVFEYDPTAVYNVLTLKPLLEGSIVKVVVNSKPNPKHYKDFIKVLNDIEMIEYRVIDQTVVEVNSVQISESDLILDTGSVFEKYIEKQEDPSLDKDAIKTLMKDVLTRAQQAQL